MKPKHKYIVTVETVEIDSDKQIKSQYFEFQYTQGTFLDMRNAAFEKFEDMTTFFNNEIPEDQEFDSPLTAAQKNYTNINTRSIGVYLSVDDDEIPIFVDNIYDEEGREAEEYEFAQMNLILE